MSVVGGGGALKKMLFHKGLVNVMKVCFLKCFPNLGCRKHNYVLSWFCSFKPKG